MNNDEMIEMGDPQEPNQYIIDKEDYALLQAVKNLLQYANIRVPNGSNTKLEIADSGYSYSADMSRILSYSAARTRELVKYREKLGEDLQQTQKLFDQLPNNLE